MPSSIINKVSNKCDMSKAEAEDKWEEAKQLAKDEDQDDNYAYIMSIFKNLVGKDCAKKMKWNNKNESIIEKVFKYLY